MRGILRALAKSHRGGVMSSEQLWRAGWGEQRALPEAVTNRLHVALSNLRKRGLKPYLLRDDQGYQLDPRVAIRWLPNEWLILSEREKQ